MVQSLAPYVPFTGAFKEMKTWVWRLSPSNCTLSSCTQGMEAVIKNFAEENFLRAIRASSQQVGRVPKEMMAAALVTSTLAIPCTCKF